MIFQKILGIITIIIGIIFIFYGAINFGEIGTMLSEPEKHGIHSCWIIIGIGLSLTIYGIDLTFIR